jgi:hypothetical protein
MHGLTQDEIQTALDRLERGLRQYLWLQGHVRSCNVSANEEFQRRFNAFYKVRRGPQWRSTYFALLESAKSGGMDFSETLKELHFRTGRIEASFSSKLVATLDSSKPVIDIFVLKHFELCLPRSGLSDRETRTIDLYRELCARYSTFIQSPTGKLIRELFDGRYSQSEVSELKKIDLVLWQIRPKRLT